jgi:hypothetical protein
VILTEVQERVRDQRCVSLADLSGHFEVEPEALRAMLERLVRKGRVRRLARPGACGGCRACPDEALDFYAWADDPAACAAPACSGSGGLSRRPG